MRITHVIPYMHPNAGGPPVVVDRICRRLVDRGHTVRVITTDLMARVQNGWEKIYADSGYQLDIYSAKGTFGYSRLLGREIPNAIRESDLAHLHTNWTYPTLRAAWACRRYGIPYVLMPHGMLDPNSVQRKWLKKWLYVKMLEGPNLRKAAGLFFTHPEEERLARETVAGLPMSWIVPLAADEPPSSNRTDLSRQFFDEHLELAGNRVVLFLGRLHPKKGLDLLIPAFAEVARRLANVRLVLIGPGEEQYIRELRILVERLGISKLVSILPPVSGRRKWAALAAASVFALPSYQENFAITAVEAMSVGTPILLSHRVNIWREIENFNAGMITLLDTSMIADNLSRIIENEDYASSIGSNGKMLARDSYNWDRTTSVVEAAYRTILTQSTHVRDSECFGLV
jgi:glycosyltransferase involved in cell wall biosynthesis